MKTVALTYEILTTPLQEQETETETETETGPGRGHEWVFGVTAN
jgi:hypothetical protein